MDVWTERLLRADRNLCPVPRGFHATLQQTAMALNLHGARVETTLDEATRTRRHVSYQLAQFL